MDGLIEFPCIPAGGKREHDLELAVRALNPIGGNPFAMALDIPPCAKTDLDEAEQVH
jgi:hypothetical protein